MTMLRSLLTVAAVLAGTLACGGDAGVPPGARPTVAVSTNILADVAAEIGGDDIAIVDLMPRGADPHSFGLSAHQSSRIETADLIVVNGLGLEEGLAETLASIAGDVPILEVGPHLDPIPFATDVASAGPTLDPHVWTDPQRMTIAVDVLTDAFVELAPHRSDAIERRAARYRDELEDLDRWISAELEAIHPEDRLLVTNHHVFGYFATRYGFTEVGAIIPSGTTLASPSAADLADLAQQIRTAGVSTIFAESSQPDRLAGALASEVGVDVEVVTLYTESLGPEDSDAATYLEMMRFNAAAIVDSLA